MMNRGKFKDIWPYACFFLEGLALVVYFIVIELVIFPKYPNVGHWYWMLFTGVVLCIAALLRISRILAISLVSKIILVLYCFVAIGVAYMLIAVASPTTDALIALVVISLVNLIAGICILLK